MLFGGIDYDTFGVHVVLLPEEGLSEYRYFELKGHDPFERARQVREAMPPRAWWTDEGVVAVCIEEQHSNNPKMRVVVQKLKLIQGAILACLPRDLLVAPRSATEWRADVELPGNASKEAVREFVEEQRFGQDRYLENVGTCQEPLFNPVEAEAWPQDACDAYCLALAAEKLTQTEVAA